MISLKIPMLGARAAHFRVPEDFPYVDPKQAPKSSTKHENLMVCISLISIWLREFLSTYCFLLLGSRLGSDLFIARPMVLAYISMMFRRPIMNPMVTLFACATAYDWKKANVSGIPFFQKDFTNWKWLLAYCLSVMGVQLAASAAAAETKAYNSMTFGDEFIKNAAWGSGQLRLIARNGSCWDGTELFPVEKSIHNVSSLIFNDNDKCITRVRAAWWFMEDLASMLFLMVSYMHIWIWLRWDDVEVLNPADNERRYWMKIAAFSAAAGIVALMNSLAFPTADAGWHVSLYLYRYQELRSDLTITSNKHGEFLYRGLGSLIGCFLAFLYEKMIIWVDDVDLNKPGAKATFAEILHTMIYTLPQCWHKTDKLISVYTLEELLECIQMNNATEQQDKAIYKIVDYVKNPDYIKNRHRKDISM